MTIADIIILCIIGIGAIRGFARGFIHQLASIAGLIAGFFIARALYLMVAEKLSVYIPEASMTTLQVAAFIVIWLIIPLLFALVAEVFTRAAEALSLGGFNRILGLFLGAAKWVLIVALLINIIDFIDTDNRFIPQTTKKESRLYYPVKQIISRFFPAAEQVTDEYILI